MPQLALKEQNVFFKYAIKPFVPPAVKMWHKSLSPFTPLFDGGLARGATVSVGRAD